MLQNDKYTVSIVIPNYNNGKYLRECVESMINQTYPIKEIVIVDDCSTDSSNEVIEKLSQKYNNITAVFLESNMGVSHARNIGFRASSGRYISFLDADDFYVNKDKIKNEIELIKKYEPEPILALSYMADCEVTSDKIDYSVKRYLPQGDVHLEFFFGGFFTHNQLMKRELFEEAGGYDENCSLYEDWKLLIKLSQKYRFIYTGEYGSAYRHGIPSLSTANIENNKRVKQELLKEYFDTLCLQDKIYVKCRKAWDIVRNKVCRVIRGK